MMKNTINQPEPSAELRLLAKLYVSQDQQLCNLPSDKLMRSWCNYLETNAPEILDLPIIHLVNVILNAKDSCEVGQRAR